jgi:hypothetical protein
MNHIKSFEEFAEGRTSDTPNDGDKVATVTVEKKNYVVEYAGDRIVVKGSTNEDGQDDTLVKIAEAAQRLGATHIYNESEEPAQMAVQEIFGAVKKLFKKNPQHKSIWGHINQD